jgi:hypothetical protein
MKIAVLSESPADEAAIEIIVSGILNEDVQRVSTHRLRARGWPSVLQVLPTVIKHLHYQTDAEALVVVVDSDDSAMHRPPHEVQGSADVRCRMCGLRNVTEMTCLALRRISTRQPLRVALGVAFPAIEAWYRAVIDGAVTEAAWAVGAAGGSPPYTKVELKRRVYGTDRPSLALEEERATQQARRISADLDQLEAAFPNGFGPLLRTVRRWAAERTV